jgi:hypothetical protein
MAGFINPEGPKSKEKGLISERLTEMANLPYSLDHYANLINRQGSMGLKARVSDFKGEYQTYSVLTEDGWAFKGPTYGRAVDTGHGLPESSRYVLTAKDLQALYGDTMALRVINSRNKKPWPDKVEVYSESLKMISLRLSFNQVSKLMAEAAKPDNDKNPDAVYMAFHAATHGKADTLPLVPFGRFFILPESALPQHPGQKEFVSTTTVDHALECLDKKPEKVIFTTSHATRLLMAAHELYLTAEAAKPGFVTERMYIAGLYRDQNRQPVSFPVANRNEAPITRVTSELCRINPLKPAPAV